MPSVVSTTGKGLESHILTNQSRGGFDDNKSLWARLLTLPSSSSFDTRIGSLSHTLFGILVLEMRYYSMKFQYFMILVVVLLSTSIFRFFLCCIRSSSSWLRCPRVTLSYTHLHLLRPNFSSFIFCVLPLISHCSPSSIA